MLSKCANSVCAKSFRYLHEGKLFWREPGKGFIKNQICRGEWFWLCDQCLGALLRQPSRIGTDQTEFKPAF
jgi:hypothetical protein